MIRLGGQTIGLFLGLSTETKPTASANSSSFYLETDTGKVFAVVTGAWTDSVATPMASKAATVGLKLYIRDAQATPHYWQVTVSTVGVLTTTDAGTTVPTDGIVIHA